MNNRKTIAVSLPITTIEILKKQAKELGMTVSGYINYLIILNQKGNENDRNK